MALADIIRNVATRLTDVADYKHDVDDFCFMSGVNDPFDIAELMLTIEDEIGLPDVFESFPIDERLTIRNMVKHVHYSASTKLSEVVPVRVEVGCPSASSS